MVQLTGFFNDSDSEYPSNGPTLASLSTSNKSVHASIRKANDRLTESLVKIKDLGDEINELRREFGERVARVAKAAGVEHALNQPI